MEEQTKFAHICKELMTKELKEKFDKSPNFIVTNYFGLSANDLNELRAELRKVSSRYFVVKNTFAKRVLDSMKIDDAKELIDGGVGIGFVEGDTIETSKAIVGFSKKHENFKIRGAYIDGQALETNRLKELSALPSREVLLAMVARTLQAPISGFVGVLGGVLRKFAYAIKAIKEKKESGK